MATPTWEYVQQVISSNIDKADDAIRLAENQMTLIANQYTAIQNDSPTDWFVDVNVGAQIPVAWPNTVSAIAGPVEPDYTTLVPTSATVPAVTVPGGISVAATPTFDVELPPDPASLPVSALSAVAVLEPLPLISVNIPVMDVDALTTDFTFTEAAYVERISPEIQVQLERVLGGDMGIPQSYWDDLWTEVSNDLARQQAGALRNARNRGAATHWGLPTEAVLTASRQVADEGERKLVQVRLEQAKQQAVFAREDFWQAVTQGINYENQWLAFHNQVQTRALTAAEQLYTLRVQMHNANLALFNGKLEAAKLDGAIDDLTVQRVLKKHAAELSRNTTEIEQDKTILQRYLAGWQGYQIDTAAQTQAMGEKIKWWNSQVDAQSRYETLKQEKAKIDVQNYSALLSRIEAVSRGAATLLQARTGATQFTLANQTAMAEQDVRKNVAAIEVGKITQAAQEIDGKLKIAQTQWLGGQGNTLLQELSQLAIGLAQSLITVSDVNLGSSYSGSDSSSISASRNEQKVW